MQTSPAGAYRTDARSLVAAALCVLALFFDVTGWAFAIAGIILLRRAAFGAVAKWALAAMAIVPKILFVVVRWMNAPAGLSFPIEPRNIVTSPALWAWSALLAAFGVFLIFMSRRLEQPAKGPRLAVAALGGVAIAVAAFLPLGLTDGFHRIDDAGEGRWALRHAVRGNVAVFTAGDLESIDAVEKYYSRSGRSYAIRLALAGGQSFSVTTKSGEASGQLRKFAATAGLAPGKVRIVRRRGGQWTNGASGLNLNDCVGIYELADPGNGPRSTFEFWLDHGRLSGRETVADSTGRHVRALRNVKLNDTGEVEFERSAYAAASKEEKGTIALSFGWSSDPETARFVSNGLEIGPQKYRKR